VPQVTLVGWSSGDIGGAMVFSVHFPTPQGFCLPKNQGQPVHAGKSDGPRRSAYERSSHKQVKNYY